MIPSSGALTRGQESITCNRRAANVQPNYSSSPSSRTLSRTPASSVRDSQLDQALAQRQLEGPERAHGPDVGLPHQQLQRQRRVHERRPERAVRPARATSGPRRPRRRGAAARAPDERGGQQRQAARRAPRVQQGPQQHAGRAALGVQPPQVERARSYQSFRLRGLQPPQVVQGAQRDPLAARLARPDDRRVLEGVAPDEAAPRRLLARARHEPVRRLDPAAAAGSPSCRRRS